MIAAPKLVAIALSVPESEPENGGVVRGEDENGQTSFLPEPKEKVLRIVQLPAVVLKEYEDGAVDATVFLDSRTGGTECPVRFMVHVPFDTKAESAPSWSSYADDVQETGLAKTPLVVEGTLEPNEGAKPFTPIASDAEVVTSPEDPPFDPNVIQPGIGINALLGAFAGLPGGAYPMPQAVLDLQAGKKPPELPSGPPAKEITQQVFGATKRARMQSGIGGGPRFGSPGIAMAAGRGGDMPESAVMAMVGTPAAGVPGQKSPRVFFKAGNGPQREITPQQNVPKIKNETDALSAILEETKGDNALLPAAESGKPAAVPFQGTIQLRGSVDGMGGSGGAPI